MRTLLRREHAEPNVGLVLQHSSWPRQSAAEAMSLIEAKNELGGPGSHLPPGPTGRAMTAQGKSALADAALGMFNIAPEALKGRA